MSAIVYRIQTLLAKILAKVPVGTNLGLGHLFLTILSGRLLSSRGALFPALTDFGLTPQAVRRAEAALCYGHFQTDTLVANWQNAVFEEGGFQPHAFERVQPVACDLIGFFRPQFQAALGKHYHSLADKALPAVSVGIIGAVGSVGSMRFALPKAIVCQDAGDLREKALKQRTLERAKSVLEPGQVGIFDAGFEVEELLSSGIGDFVVRGALNFTARRNFLPPYKGVGRHPEYGEVVRPLARPYKNREIAATPCDDTARWKVGKRWLKAYLFNALVPEGSKPGGKSLRCVVIVDPQYKHPLVLVTTLCVTAYARWCLYRDRWPIEQIPLAAKQMLGAVRALVFNPKEPGPLADRFVAGRQSAVVGGREQPGDSHGLLGSLCASDVRTAAPGVGGASFPRLGRSRRSTPKKGEPDGSLAQGSAGASASQGRYSPCRTHQKGGVSREFTGK